MNFSLQKKLHGANGEMRLNAQARILGGLMQPDSGHIQIDGETWFDSDRKINFTPQQRNVGLVFQDYALFPNMTVRANLEFAQKKNADKKHVDELIEAMQLGDLQYQYPTKLSGGQQQRVALARTLAQESKVLLLDEPLSALDTDTRRDLQDFLLIFHKKYQPTIILVSHDIGEIFRLVNRVFVLANGQIVRTGTPLEVFAEGNEKLKGRVIEVDGKQGFVAILIGNEVVRKQIKGEFSVGQEVIVSDFSVKNIS